MKVAGCRLQVAGGGWRVAGSGLTKKALRFRPEFIRLVCGERGKTVQGTC